LVIIIENLKVVRKVLLTKRAEGWWPVLAAIKSKTSPYRCSSGSVNRPKAFIKAI
jgi:hypothetical protein